SFCFLSISTSSTSIYTLSLHDALPIFFGTKGLNAKQRAQYAKEGRFVGQRLQLPDGQEVSYLGMTPKGKLMVKRISDDQALRVRSEEHTSELQSRENLVCRLLLEKKKK